MKNSGHVVFSLFLIAVAGYAIYSAAGWSFKTGFFPLAIAIPLMVMALLHLALELFSSPETAGSAAVDTEFARDIAPAVAWRRVIAIFAWIAAFIVFVYLFSFPVAVPLFIFLFLKVQSNVSWSRSIAMTVVTWGCFYAVFERLIHLRFEPGWVQTMLGL
jgi:hypothetical protein